MTDTTTQAVTALLDKARAAQADAKDYREANGITQIAPGFMPLMIDTLAALLDNRNTAQANYAATWQAKERLIKERDALAAQLAAAELRARESALDALAAYGQAAEAHTAQLSAEARVEAMQVVLELTAQAGSFNARTAENAKAKLETAWDDALEEAASEVAAMAETDAHMSKVWRNGCRDAADAIRAMKGQKP